MGHRQSPWLVWLFLVFHVRLLLPGWCPRHKIWKDNELTQVVTGEKGLWLDCLHENVASSQLLVRFLCCTLIWFHAWTFFSLLLDGAFFLWNASHFCSWVRLQGFKSSPFIINSAQLVEIVGPGLDSSSTFRHNFPGPRPKSKAWYIRQCTKIVSAKNWSNGENW